MHISYNQLSELTGLSYRTLKKRIDGLQPVGTGRTKANLWESIDALPLIYMRNGKGDTNKLDAKKIDFNEEKARLAKEQADGQALKNAEKRRELIPASEINEAWSRIVVAIKLQLLALPGRLRQMHKTALTEKEKEAMTMAEIKSMLEGLASGEVNKKNKKELKNGIIV